MHSVALSHFPKTDICSKLANYQYRGDHFIDLKTTDWECRHINEKTSVICILYTSKLQCNGCHHHKKIS